MAGAAEFILGEYQRTLDERFRLSIPTELVEALGNSNDQYILVKERLGCLSLWNAAAWQSKLNDGVELIRGKMRAGRLEGRLGDVQVLGRLLSTRHKALSLTGRGRLMVPEGFREFLRVEPGSDCLVVGAAVCIEIWSPAAWLAYLEKRIPRFRRLFDRLSS